MCSLENNKSNVGQIFMLLDVKTHLPLMPQNGSGCSICYHYHLLYWCCYCYTYQIDPLCCVYLIKLVIFLFLDIPIDTNSAVSILCHSLLNLTVASCLYSIKFICLLLLAEQPTSLLYCCKLYVLSSVGSICLRDWA